MKERIASILILLVFSALSTLAQYEDLRFRSLTKEDGLTSNRINCIASDENGFIWIGEQYGLNKYNGLDVVSYKYEMDDTTSIPSNEVRTIYVDKENTIWIGTTQGGFSKYNREKDNFTRIPLYLPSEDEVNVGRVVIITQHSNGEMWLGTIEGDLLIYNEDRNTFRKIDDPGNELFNTVAVTGIFEDSEKNMWVCRRRPIIDIYHPEKGLIDQIAMPYMVSPDLPANNKYLLFESDASTVWIATQGEGLFKYNIKDKSFRKIEQLEDYDIRKLYDMGDKIAMAADNKGLILLDKKTFEIQLYEAGADEFSISCNYIRDIHFDQRGILWLATWDGGVNYYNPLNHQFAHHYPIDGSNSISNRLMTDIIELSDGNILISTFGGGLDLYDPKTGKFSKPNYGGSDDYVNKSPLYSLFEHQGDLYVSAYGKGISRINMETGEIINFSSNRAQDRYIPSNFISEIIGDSKGAVWFSSYLSSLYRYFPNTDRNITGLEYKAHDLLNNIHKSYFILVLDNDGNLWAGNREGYLSLFDYEIEEFTSYLIGYDEETNRTYQINSIYQDDNNIFWIGTDGGGLRRFDYETKDVKIFREEEGLPSNNVYDILPDNNGNIWFSTMNGLCSFNLESYNILVYNKDDGLQDDQFKKTNAVLAKDGTMYFGGVNGFNSFKPDEITKDTFCGQLVFTDFKLFNKSVPLGGDSPLKKHISYTDEITLSYKDNVISLDFILIDYTDPKNVQYSYMLEGFDKEWRQTNNEQRSATYTNLSGGTYTFRVKAKNHDGFECGQPLELTIKVIPAFYQTLLFKSLIGLVILFIVLSIYLMRMRMLGKQKKYLEEKVKVRTLQIQKQNTELELHKNNLEELVDQRTKDLKVAKEKAEESDRLKSSFLTNMSHEIRTPLNAIIGFSGFLAKHDLSREKKELFFMHIQKSGDALLNLINDIIDISRIEAGEISITNEKLGVVQFVTDIHAEYENKMLIRGLKSIEIRKEVLDNECIIIVDPLRLRQVVINLLENAIKFTEEGSITLKVEEDAKEVRISVIDSGIGIPVEHQDFIFDRFTKLENDSQKLYRGTGLGLFICKRLVNYYNGTIGVSSELNAGSNFWFTLPKTSESNKKVKPVLDQKPQEKITNTTYSWEGKQILIVDDEITNILYLQTVLEETKAEIFEALTGDKAIEIAKENPSIDIILMDLKMPGKDGIEATREIRKTNKDVVIIAQTAHAMSEQKKKAMQAGCNDYLVKPLKETLLLETISKYF